MPRICAALLALGLIAFPVLANEPPEKTKLAHWTHWRGPSGQGYVEDASVPLVWSEKENVVWKTKLPAGGHSTPIIWGNRIFLTGATDKGADRKVFCVEAGTGKVLWQQTAANGTPFEPSHNWNGYASASCATDGKHVFAFFGSPGLFCYDMDGKELWKKSFGIFTSKQGWGTAASPFIYQDTVIVNCDNDGGPGSAPAALVALDVKTGEQRWATPRNMGRGFSTPRLMKMADGRIDLVLNGASGVWGYDPATGKERWHCRRSDPKEQHKFGEPLPVDDGERMFILSGRTGPMQLLKMPGLGDVTTSHVIHSEKRGARDVASPMLWEGRIYVVNMEAKLTCFDAKTGRQLYQGEFGKRLKSMASPIALAGKLLWLLDDGTTVVVQPGPKLDIVGRNKLAGGSLDYGASPAAAHGRLYLRSQSYLYCIGNKK